MTDGELEEAEKITDLWNRQGAPNEVQTKVSSLEFKLVLLQHDILLREAKKKLAKDIKKKVDEWKFGSGALVMCLVAYSDGHVHAFQYVSLSNLMIMSLTLLPVLRVLL